jgi:malate synthase
VHVARLEIAGPVRGRHGEVLTPEALDFLAALLRQLGPRRDELLADRDRHARRQRALEAGELPGFLSETAHLRGGGWRVPPPPPHLADRRVEMVGPADRETVVHGLSSGAPCFLADLEDATSPTWENVLDSQVQLRDAVRRALDLVSPEGKVYALAGRVATLHVRPRGWHLPEKHLRLDGTPVPAALFDAGLYLFHNARELAARGSGPSLYLAKLESHLDARLWCEVFGYVQEALGLAAGTIRATAMIETLPAAFEAEEILWELGEHALGLACGRWDYIFSCLKTLGRLDLHGALSPERAQLTMDQPFLAAYCRQVVRVCRRRGAQAIGGMAAQIPIPDDPEANAAALAQVRADKEREVAAGFDGTWVGHPGLVPIALAAFDRPRPPIEGSEQRESPAVTRDELLAPPPGTITEAGVRLNLRVGVQYLAAWLGGLGWVPLDHRLEDAATAEISRAQLWQWLHRGARLADGRPVTADLYRMLLAEELARSAAAPGSDRSTEDRSRQAAELFLGSVEAPWLEEFLILRAYELLP